MLRGPQPWSWPDPLEMERLSKSVLFRSRLGFSEVVYLEAWIWSAHSLRQCELDRQETGIDSSLASVVCLGLIFLLFFSIFCPFVFHLLRFLPGISLMQDAAESPIGFRRTLPAWNVRTKYTKKIYNAVARLTVCAVACDVPQTMANYAEVAEKSGENLTWISQGLSSLDYCRGVGRWWTLKLANSPRSGSSNIYESSAAESMQ